MTVRLYDPRLQSSTVEAHHLRAKKPRASVDALQF